MELTKVKRQEFITPRCTSACPAGVDVPRYIRAVKDQRYDEALAVLREKLPLPVVCADVCFAPCEEVCAYRQFGDPIAIRAIKRAAVDKGGTLWKTRKKVAESSGKKVAVVGSGPAGLTASYYLLTKGHQVTIFDSFPKPGGMMRYGIPEYRLPEQRLEKDIGEVISLGAIFKGNMTIGKDLAFRELKKSYDAVFVATGANASVRIPLDGVNKKGVYWGWDFLRDVRLGKQLRFSGDALVIGGGNVAIDVALTARRLGVERIHLLCLESREEMPAHQWEIKRAEEEGIAISNGWAPESILGKEKVEAVRFIRCVRVFDDSGKFNPTYDVDITQKLTAEHLFLAVGQTTDLEFLRDEMNITVLRSLITVNESDLTTGEEGVFAGGDVVTGPDSVIGAIDQGRRAGSAIDLYLGGDGNIDEVLAEPENEVLLAEFVPDIKARKEMRLLRPWERSSGFQQVELGLRDPDIPEESGRCLSCDARKFEVTVYTENCKECGYCAEVCNMEVFAPANYFNAKGYRPEEVKSSAWCCGCFKCYFACPDFAIDIEDRTGSNTGGF